MDYRIKKQDIGGSLLVEMLQTLSDCYAQLDLAVYVVGAVARDLTLRLLNITDLPRRTMDLDVAVALSDWSQYERLTQLLLDHRFSKAKEKQRFYYQGESGSYRYEVDVVPFGVIAESEEVAWPPEGSPVMSVRCFQEVMNHADRIFVDDLFSFYIPSLSGQFLIKYDAWSDRHTVTSKDASDMVFILQHVYVAYALSRECLPEEIDLDASRFDMVVAGAEWIASDLKKILTGEHKRYYAQQLEQELGKEEESDLLNDMLDVSDSQNYALFRRALSRMKSILT